MTFFRRGRGVRHVPGQQNKLEAAYGEHLEDMKVAGVVAWYAFEALKLRLAPNTFYTPDYLVMLTSGDMEIHEVKGTSKGKPWVEDDAAVKIKVAAEKFPFRFRMAWRVSGTWMEKVYE